jgi:predicted ester cyclase
MSPAATASQTRLADGRINKDPPMSDSEANKAIVRRYFEMFNSGDMSQLADIVSEDYGDKLEGQSSGIAVIRSYLEGLKASFPDFTWTIEQIIGEGDRVAVMNRVSGTQLNDFGDIKATGNRVDFAAFQFYGSLTANSLSTGKSPTSRSSRSN